MRNEFLRLCVMQSETLPPRFPLCLALQIQLHVYKQTEVVYSAFDHAFNLFFVVDGTFACVAVPGDVGGQVEVSRVVSSTGGSPFQRRQQRLKKKGTSMSTTATESVSDNDLGDKSMVLHRIFKSFKRSRNDPALNAGQYMNRLFNTNSGNERPSAGRPSLTPSEVEQQIFFPYRLFGAHSYFGDWEFFTGDGRRTCVRCETHEGNLMTLPKVEFMELVSEFPHYVSVWKSRARHREWVRSTLLERLRVPGIGYQALAVLTVQRFVRERRAKREARAAANIVIDREKAPVLRPLRSLSTVDGTSVVTAPLREREANLFAIRGSSVASEASLPEAMQHTKAEVSLLRQEVDARHAAVMEAISALAARLGTELP